MSMSDRFRASLALLCGAFALVVGGAALLSVGAGLVTLLSEPVDWPSALVPVASFAGWGAWRLLQ